VVQLRQALPASLADLEALIASKTFLTNKEKALLLEQLCCEEVEGLASLTITQDCGCQDRCRCGEESICGAAVLKPRRH
jgi:hypothetical protein